MKPFGAHPSWASGVHAVVESGDVLDDEGVLAARVPITGLAGAVGDLQIAVETLRQLFVLSEAVSLAVSAAKGEMGTTQIHLHQALDGAHTAQSIAESAASILASL